MKKKAIIAVLVFSMTLSLAVFASAKEIAVTDKLGKTYYIGDNNFTVEFNGKSVMFPDAQPFVNEDGRTLVPLRFVAETMGAKVTWNEKESTATIQKSGILVDVTIGKDALMVTENGKTSTVTMDTVAVIKDNRTFVPVRFVAEALGAWVGYSDLFNTAQIYSDVLTPTEITRLHSYSDLSWDEYIAASGDNAYGVTEDDWLKSYPQIAYFTGTGEFGFCNANQWALCEPEGSYSLDVPTYPVEAFTGVLSKKPFKFGKQENLDCAKIALEEAVKGVTVQFKDVEASLRTDLSCVFSSRHCANGNMLVRGVLTMAIPQNADIQAIESKYGIKGIKTGETYYLDVELKIAVLSGKIGAVKIDTLKGPDGGAL